MQPPPRKGNYFKVCKNLHSEQLSKLQAKNQQECDLLEDIRNFMKQRSAIEKSYGEALCKIATAYQNRKIACVPDIRLEDGSEAWNVYSVWRTVLDETEKLGKARLAAVEVFHQRISEDAKQVRQNKVNLGKKLIDTLGVIQKEVQNEVQNLDRTKRSYYEEENVAYDAREKASAAEEKLKRKKGSIFQSISSLQKNSAKFTAKKELCDEKSAGARNDYLLSLSAANAHQRRYYEQDFERILRTMECDMYDKVSEYLILLSRTELLTCSASQNSYTKIREQAQTITRGYNLRCYLTFYPMLGKHIEYDYEPCKGDQITVVRIHDDNSREILNSESKKSVATILKQVKIIREATKKIHKLQSSHKEGELPPEVECKIEDIRQIIRRAETTKYKAEAKIDTLKDGGIEVEDYSKSIDTDSLGTEMETPLSRSGSTASVKEEVDMDGEVAPTSVSSDKQFSMDSADADKELESQYSQDQTQAAQQSLGPTSWDPVSVDWGDEPVSPLPPVTNGPPADEIVYPKCTVLYNYTAQNPDELTIIENEEIEMISEGDGDGWVQARNYKGEVGYIPHNYVEMEEGAGFPAAQFPEDTTAAAPETATSNGFQYDATGEEELEAPISFSSIDYDFEAAEDADGDTTSIEAPSDLPPPPPLILTGVTENRPCVPTIDLPAGGDATSHSIYCMAVYDYEATCDEELTFEEGQIIRILKKSVHDVDDGWWEGEMDGKVGLFPSLVVEECRGDGEPLTPDAASISSPCTTPPPHTPPEVPGFLMIDKVIITQPTPDVETVEEAIALREKQKQEEQDGTATKGVGDQQQAYQRQFSSSPDSETATDRGDHQYAELVSSPEVSNQEEDAKTEVVVAPTGGGVSRPTVAPPPPPTVVPPPDENSEVPKTDVDNDKPSTEEVIDDQFIPSTYNVSEKPESIEPPTSLFLPGLGVAQIVITCPTPMKESAEEETPAATEDSRAEADQITQDDGQADSEDTEGEANFLEDDRPPPPPPAPEGGGGSGVEERREEYEEFRMCPSASSRAQVAAAAASSAVSKTTSSGIMKGIEAESLESSSNPTPKSPSPSDGPPELDPEKLKALERIRESIA